MLRVSEVHLQSCKPGNGNAANVHTLATMGTDLSIMDENSGNVFHYAERSVEPPDKKAAVLKALSEHGMKSANIPPGFQSPLYFRSIYYTEKRDHAALDESQCIDDVLE
jgi:hypothetical protein